MVMGVGSAWADEVVKIWAEDFTGAITSGMKASTAYEAPTTCTDDSYSATYSYSASKNMYYETTAGGEAPELLLPMNNGTFTVTITDLKGCSGDFTLSFSKNSSGTLAISSSTTGVTVSGNTSGSIVSVPKGTTTLVLQFKNTHSTKNMRLDNFVLTGVSSTPKYVLTFANPAGGSITVKKGGNAVSSGDKFEEGTVLDIVATPADHYDFTSWSATTGTIANSTSATTTFTMGAADAELSATFTAQDIESEVMIDDNIKHGTIAANKEKANLGETVTLTATPDEGYALGSWEVLDDNNEMITVTPVDEVTATFIMPAVDVLVSATFAEKHTVTYYVAGVENTVTRADGTALNLDAPSAVNGMPFAGWSSTNNADMTLYAIFTAQAGGVTYNLVESALSDWRGQYLIAYSSSVFADGRVGGTSGDGIGVDGKKAVPDEKLSGKVVDGTWGDTYYVTLEAINDANLSSGYVLKTQDGQYNYWTNNTANGVSVTSGKSTAASYPITVTFTSSSDVRLGLGGEASGSVFRYNTGSSGYFRFYKNGGQNAVYLYKRTVAPSVYSLGTTETLTVTDAGYATYCTPSAVNLTGDEDVKAYKATVVDDEVTFTQVTGFIAAGTGLLLVTDGGGSSSVATVGSGNDLSGNALVGVADEGQQVDGTDTNNSYYVLRNRNGNVGFYKVTAPSYNLKKGTAYLKVEGNGAKAFYGFDGMETSVNEELSIQHSESAPAYNLAGQRVDANFHGIVILNGKKVIR